MAPAKSTLKKARPQAQKRKTKASGAATESYFVPATPRISWFDIGLVLLFATAVGLTVLNRARILAWVRGEPSPATGGQPVVVTGAGGDADPQVPSGGVPATGASGPHWALYLVLVAIAFFIGLAAGPDPRQLTQRKRALLAVLFTVDTVVAILALGAGGVLVPIAAAVAVFIRYRFPAFGLFASLRGLLAPKPTDHPIVARGKTFFTEGLDTAEDLAGVVDNLDTSLGQLRHIRAELDSTKQDLAGAREALGDAMRVEGGNTAAVAAAKAEVKRLETSQAVQANEYALDLAAAHDAVTQRTTADLARFRAEADATLRKQTQVAGSLNSEVERLKANVAELVRQRDETTTRGSRQANQHASEIKAAKQHLTGLERHLTEVHAEETRLKAAVHTETISEMQAVQQAQAEALVHMRKREAGLRAMLDKATKASDEAEGARVKAELALAEKETDNTQELFAQADSVVSEWGVHQLQLVESGKASIDFDAKPDSGLIDRFVHGARDALDYVDMRAKRGLMSKLKRAVVKDKKLAAKRAASAARQLDKTVAILAAARTDDVHAAARFARRITPGVAQISDNVNPTGKRRMVQ